MLPRVRLEGSKVEKNSKQSIVTLVLPWSRAERKGDETKETQCCLQLLLAFCCNVCEIPADEVITPQHGLLLVWPVTAPVYAGTHM